MDFAILHVTVSAVGIVLNLANTTVFLMQDWRTNNVTLTLLSLSISDLLVLVIGLVFGIFSIVRTVLPTSTFDYFAVQYYIMSWSMAIFSDISSLTTVLVSLERCLCITMPLHVHSLFSVKRTLVILLGIWMLVIFSYVVIFSTLTLQWKFDNNFNISRLTVALSKDRPKIEFGHNISNAVILPSFCELAVVINTVVMVIGLRRSSDFQRKATHISSDDQSNLTSSAKYKRLAIVVCCISGIFIACNTPTVVFIYCKQFVPGFSYAGDYRDIYIVGAYGILLFFTVNASVNFVVYFSLNQRFRDKLREIVGGCGSSLRSTNSG